MFTSSCYPFKFASHIKVFESIRSKVALLTSFPCVHFPPVRMVGSMFKDKLFLCKKNSQNVFVVDDFAVESDETYMRLSSFISKFKSSEGLDFIIISLPVYFLIIRKQNKQVGVFATTTASYVEVFATLQDFFGEFEEVITSYNEYLDIGYFKKQNLADKKNLPQKKSLRGKKNASIKKDLPEKKDVVIDIDVKEDAGVKADTRVSNEEFEKILLEKEKTAKSIKLGIKKDNCIEFKRYLFYLPTTKELQEFMFAISNSSFEYVEILGTTKIAGVRKNGRMVWFSELPCMEGFESDYIEEVNSLMSPFLIGQLKTPSENKQVANQEE